MSRRLEPLKLEAGHVLYRLDDSEIKANDARDMTCAENIAYCIGGVYEANRGADPERIASDNFNMYKIEVLRPVEVLERRNFVPLRDHRVDPTDMKVVGSREIVLPHGTNESDYKVTLLGRACDSKEVMEEMMLAYKTSDQIRKGSRGCYWGKLTLMLRRGELAPGGKRLSMPASFETDADIALAEAHAINWVMLIFGNPKRALGAVFLLRPSGATYDRPPYDAETQKLIGLKYPRVAWWLRKLAGSAAAPYADAAGLDPDSLVLADDASSLQTAARYPENNKYHDIFESIYFSYVKSDFDLDFRLLSPEEFAAVLPQFKQSIESHLADPEWRSVRITKDQLIAVLAPGEVETYLHPSVDKYERYVSRLAGRAGLSLSAEEVRTLYDARTAAFKKHLEGLPSFNDWIVDAALNYMENEQYDFDPEYDKVRNALLNFLGKNPKWPPYELSKWEKETKEGVQGGAKLSDFPLVGKLREFAMTMPEKSAPDYEDQIAAFKETFMPESSGAAFADFC